MKNNKARRRNMFIDTILDVFHVLWFIIYHLWKALRYMCVAPVRAIKCKIGYYESPFFKVTGIEKERILGGSSWKIGNDPRYVVCNAISKMKLPLEAISAVNPSIKDESLMYYHIYKDTIIITHGFYQATMWNDNNYHIDRNHYDFPEEYGTAYSVSEFAKMKWMEFIHPEHQSLPIKVLHSNKKYQFQGRPSDTYDLSSNGIFYRRLKNLKKIFQ